MVRGCLRQEWTQLNSDKCFGKTLCKKIPQCADNSTNLKKEEEKNKENLEKKKKKYRKKKNDQNKILQTRLKKNPAYRRQRIS